MNKYKSDDISAVVGSLAKAQGSYKTLIANEDGPYGMFANLQAIIAATRESLSLNGLSFYQYVELQDEGSGASLLWSTIAHEGGQYIASGARIMQEHFAKIEDYKRIHAYLILGIAPVGRDPLLIHEQDAIEKMAATKPRAPKYIRPSHSNSLTTDEYNDLMWELEEYPEVAKSILKYYSISTIADLPREEYYPAKAQIKKIKKTHEDYAKNS